MASTLAASLSVLLLPGCGAKNVGVLSQADSSSGVCVPQNLICSRPAGLDNLKNVGSCNPSNDTCGTTVGLGAICTLAPDFSGDLCELACTFDSDCPVGAYCSDIGSCTFDCDGSAANACPSGQSCDCNGRCAATCQAPPQATPKPSLSTSVSSLTLTLPSSAAGAQATGTLDVILTANDAATATGAATLPISVTAPAGLTVACDSTTASGSAQFPASCSIAAWAFVPVGAQWVARRTISVRLVPWAAQLATQTFTLTIPGDNVVNPTQLVAVTGQVQSSTPATLGDGSYTGIVSMQANANGPSSLDVPIPVTAYLRNGNLVLSDATGSLSSSGLIYFNSQLAQYTDPWLTHASLTGTLPATIRPLTVTQAVQQGQVQGSYSVYVGGPGPQAYSFTLTPSGALPACSSANLACPSGTNCDTSAGLCSPQSAPAVSISGPPTHQLEYSWVSALHSLITGPTLNVNAGFSEVAGTSSAVRYIVGDVYGNFDDQGHQLAAPKPHQSDFVWQPIDFVANNDYNGSDPIPADLGYQLCQRDFANAIAVAVPEMGGPLLDWHYWRLRLRNVRSLNGQVAPTEYGTTGIDPNVYWGIFDGSEQSDAAGTFWQFNNQTNLQIHSFVPAYSDYGNGVVPGMLCEMLYNYRPGIVGNYTTANWPTNVLARKQLVPCLADAPNSPAPGRGWWSDAADSVMCSTLYNDMQPLLGQATYAQFVNDQCQPTAAEFMLYNAATATGGVAFRGAQDDQFDPPYRTWESWGTQERSFDVMLCPHQPQSFDVSSTHLAEAWNCWNPAGAADPSILESSRLSSSVLPSSGDLRCAPNPREPCVQNGAPSCGGNVPEAFPFFTNQDYRSLIDPSVILPDDEALYADCINELGQTPTSAQGSATGAIPQIHAMFDARPACVSLARVLPEIDNLLGPQRYDLHLLQQWLGVHQFIANQAPMRTLGNRIADPNDATRDLSVPRGLDVTTMVNGHTLEAPLDVLERGLTLFVDSSTKLLFELVNGSLIADPDYREDVPGFADATTGRPQTVGLPVTMLQTLAAYLDALAFHAQQVDVATFDSCPGNDPHGYRQTAITRIDSGLRLAGAVELVAEGLYNAAVASSKPIAWSGQWTAARSAYFASRANTQSRLRTLFTCQNPLGINDGDTPIFFASGSAGPTAATFSSADFLVPLAQQALVTVTNAETAARTAWNNRATDGYNQQVYQSNRSQRINGVETQYGSTLLDLCGAPPNISDGATMFSQFTSSTSPPPPIVLTPDNCFIANEKPSCAADPMSDASCLRGQIGEAAAAILAARDAVKVARSQADEAASRFSVQSQYCAQLAKSTQNLQQVLAAVQQNIQGISGMLEIDSTLTTMLNAVTSGVDSAAGTFGASVVMSMFQSMAAMGILNSNAQSMLLQSQQQYQTLLQNFAFNNDVQQCWNQATDYHNAIQTAQLTITQQVQGVQDAVQRFNDLHAQAQVAVSEGLSQLALEQTWSVPPPVLHYFVKEMQADYALALLQAQRLTYLALEAVQYETQTSIAELGPSQKRDILAATNPSHLANVITKINADWTNAKRGQWTPNFFVVDLKGVVDDRSLASVPGRDATQTQRFQDMLWSPANAVYDQLGNYVGQGIPFTLTRNSTSPTDGQALRGMCGERLWDVAALIKLNASWQPVVDVELQRRNTFYSQYCNGNTDDSHFQVAAIIPGTNPFTGTGADSSSAADRFSPADFHASITGLYSDFVSSAVLPSNEFQTTGRFADEGLYGDYMLVFKYAQGPLGIPAGQQFPLEQVEDIYLRFDFVAQTNSASINEGLMPPTPQIRLHSMTAPPPTPPTPPLCLAPVCGAGCGTKTSACGASVDCGECQGSNQSCVKNVCKVVACHCAKGFTCDPDGACIKL